MMRKNSSKALALLAAGWAAAVACSSDPGGGGGSSGGDAGPLPEASTPTADGGAADASDAGEPPGPPAVRFVGRWDTRDPKGPRVTWPGARAIARFTGPRVSVTLAEDPLDEGPSELDAIVDGASKKIVLSAGTKSYALAEGLGPGPHSVELYKRTGPHNGMTQLLGFDFGGGALLAPPPGPSRRIEIVGDSQPAALGYEGVGPDCGGPEQAARFQNFHASFGARLGAIFDADVHGTTFPGKGVYYNIWRPDLDLMGLLFTRALAEDPESPWDFTRFVPDVVVVMIGGNDFDVGLPSDTGPAPLAGFEKNLGELVARMRQEYAAAHVVLAVSPSVSDAYPVGRKVRTNVKAGMSAVAAARAAAGDARVTTFEPGLATAGELTGCDGHGNDAFHGRVAAELAQVIRDKTGWK